MQDSDTSDASDKDGPFDDDSGDEEYDGPTHHGSTDGERLQKVLARVGIGSRRVSEDLIEDGRVTVNDLPVRLGARVDIDRDVVAVDGVPIGVKPGLVYYLLNKPVGVVTTADDPQGRDTAISMVPDEPRVHSVGRLDLDTEGLLLLTNDGQLTHRLTHPSFGVDKEYVAEVEGTPSRWALRQLRDGVELDDGPTAPASASSPGPGIVKLVIHEGRNRQVRRMCAAVGHPVLRLVRTRIGPLSDSQLRPGTWRELTTDEVRELERAVSDQVDAAVDDGAEATDGSREGGPEHGS